MKILTNKITKEYNYMENYFNVYVFKIYKFKKNELNLFNHIDNLMNGINFNKIFSLYREGKKFSIYFLINKDSCENIKIEDIFDAEKLNYLKINDLTFDFFKENINDLSDDILINLLLSNFATIEVNEKVMLCNGKLYEVMKEQNNYLITLEHSFKNGCLLSRVNTFRKDSENGKYRLYGEYIIRKKMDGERYSLSGEKNKKHNVNFFNAKAYSQFKSCKMFKMQDLINKFNKKYNKYMKLVFEEKDFNEIKFQSFSDKVRSYKKLSYDYIRKLGVNIISKIGNNKALDVLKHELSIKKIKYTISNDIDKDKPNICLIHSRNYYKENNIDDAHVVSNNAAIQHLTYEDCFSISENGIQINKNALDIVIFDSIRKFELINKQIFIYKTNNEILKNYCFGQIENNKTYEISFDESNMKFTIDTAKKQKTYATVEKYIRLKDSDQLIYINKMDLYPIVNIKELNEKFQKTMDKISITKELIPLLEKIENKIEDQTIFNKIKKFINSFDEVSMANLYDEIKSKLFPRDSQERKRYSRVLKRINIELSHISDSIFFKPLWRGKNSTYNITFTNLKYLYNEQEGLKYYSATCKSVTEIINKVYVIRNVIGKFTDLEIKNYFDLLDVDNIRINQSIVEPFPFKYLREYIKMNM